LEVALAGGKLFTRSPRKLGFSNPFRAPGANTHDTETSHPVKVRICEDVELRLKIIRYALATTRLDYDPNADQIFIGECQVY